MPRQISQIAGVLALSVAPGLIGAQADGQWVTVAVTEGVIMVKQAAPVWLHCMFEPDAAGENRDVPGFCTRLRQEFARQTGRTLGVGALAPDGAEVALVTLSPGNAHRLMVSLAVGRQVAGRFEAARTQQMRLGSTDAPLRAASAAALVYPLVSLLETLH